MLIYLRFAFNLRFDLHHHKPVLTYNNNKRKVENQIVTLRFKLKNKNKKPKGKEKIFNFLMGMSLIVQK